MKNVHRTPEISRWCHDGESGRETHMGTSSRGRLWDLVQPKSDPTPGERAVSSESGELGKKNDHKKHCYHPRKSVSPSGSF